MEIYTDGACVPNPGKGGWGFAVVVNGYLIAERFGSAGDTTNNRMEFQAVIEALKWLESDTPATIHSDSKLAVNVLNGNWRGKKNTDLVKLGRDLLGKRMAVLKWIRGHNGHQWNEYADELAESEARKAVYG